tara:strand:+ start:294 stop:1022 length:729 start_codon:yes stop_codon:yes gene_type:complete
MVNIDNVYQKVLAIANKEQRGYVTPQEFNLFADQAQMQIFEQYFYDLSQFLRLPGNDTNYSDAVTNLEEKIGIFERYDKVFDVVNNSGGVNLDQSPDYSRIYRLGMVRVHYQGMPSFVVADKINLKQLMTYGESPLTAGNKQMPYYTYFKDRIKVYPNPTPVKDKVYISYVLKPNNAYWGYNVVGENALWDPNKSSNFELHSSEENDLVVKILSLAGISMKDAILYQAAEQQDSKNIQQQKQ